MNASPDTLLSLFRRDLPRAPGALFLAAATGWCLLLPASGTALAPAGALLLALGVLWQHWLPSSGMRPNRWAAGFALLPLCAVLAGEWIPAWLLDSSTLAGGLALLPVVGNSLPPLGREHPRPALARVLLPMLAPLVLGCALLLVPGAEAAPWVLTLLETAQLVALLAAGALLLGAPERDWQVVLVLVVAKVFSTLALPWWLLHAYPGSHVAWVLALALLVEGEWESRLLLALADERKDG